MRVSTFLSEIQKTVGGDRATQITRSMVAKAAQNAYKREGKTYYGLSVNLNCSGAGVKTLKLSIHLLPEHQHYCIWLKPRAQSASRSLAYFSFAAKRNGLIMNPSESVRPDLTLKEIIMSLESEIEQQTHEQIQSIRYLHDFSKEHNLSGDSLYQIYALATELQRCSSFGPRELLRKDTMASILENWIEVDTV